MTFPPDAFPRLTPENHRVNSQATPTRGIRCAGGGMRMVGSALKCAALALIGGCFLGLATAGWFAWADWVPAATLERLSGASKSEIEGLLGKPEETGSLDDGERWHYRRPFR